MDPTSFILSALPKSWAGGVLGLVAICAWLDATIPQPGPGSRWVKPRRVMSWVGGNWGHAVNAIQPGSVQATVTPASVLEAVVSTHAAAAADRQLLAGKLGDVQRRVTEVLVNTTERPQ